MPIISVEPKIRCDSSAKLTPPMAATSFMSSSPLRPTRDEEKLDDFFSLSLEAARDARAAALSAPAGVPGADLLNIPGEATLADKAAVDVVVTAVELAEDVAATAVEAGTAGAVEPGGSEIVKEMGVESVEEAVEPEEASDLKTPAGTFEAPACCC